MDGIKICSKCLVSKPSVLFHKRNENGKTRQPCIECVKKNRNKKCVDCETLFTPLGRKANRCEKCYPFFRQATTLYFSSKYRATKYNIPFDLDIDWIKNKLKDNCPKTGYAFDIMTKGKNFSSRSPLGPSLDKIDPNLGYTKDNTQLVCWWYNVTKQRFLDEEVLELCKAVVKQASL